MYKAGVDIDLVQKPEATGSRNKTLCISVHFQWSFSGLYFNMDLKSIPANIYLLKVISRNTRKRCGICLKLTIRSQNDVNDVFLVILVLTLIMFYTFSRCFYYYFEQVNVRRDYSIFLLRLCEMV